MKLKKILPLTVLVGGLAFTNTGCHRNHSQYLYEGKIDGDQVIFMEKRYGINASDDNILTITKPDGRVIKYLDRFNDDLKLEYVEITKNGQTAKYSDRDEIGKPILEEAQKQFDSYLNKIKEIKQKDKESRIKQGLENLK